MLRSLKTTLVPEIPPSKEHWVVTAAELTVDVLPMQVALPLSLRLVSKYVVPLQPLIPPPLDTQSLKPDPDPDSAPLVPVILPVTSKVKCRSWIDEPVPRFGLKFSNT